MLNFQHGTVEWTSKLSLCFELPVAFIFAPAKKPYTLWVNCINVTGKVIIL